MESSFPSFLHTKDPDVKLPWIHRVKCELPRRVGRLAGDLPVKASYIGRAWQGMAGRSWKSSHFQSVSFGKLALLRLSDLLIYIPRTPEAATIIRVWWKIDFWRGQPSNGTF